jgi:hypothetical protein
METTPTSIPHLHRSRKIKHINPLNAQLNPTCNLLSLLGVHHILHIGR